MTVGARNGSSVSQARDVLFRRTRRRVRFRALYGGPGDTDLVSYHPLFRLPGVFPDEFP